MVPNYTIQVLVTWYFDSESLSNVRTLQLTLPFTSAYAHGNQWPTTFYLLNFLSYFIAYFILFFGHAEQHGDLISPTKDRTCASCSGRRVLTLGSPGKFPYSIFYSLCWLVTAHLLFSSCWTGKVPLCDLFVTQLGPCVAFHKKIDNERKLTRKMKNTAKKKTKCDSTRNEIQIKIYFRRNSWPQKCYYDCDLLRLNRVSTKNFNETMFLTNEKVVVKKWRCFLGNFDAQNLHIESTRRLISQN